MLCTILLTVRFLPFTWWMIRSSTDLSLCGRLCSSEAIPFAFRSLHGSCSSPEVHLRTTLEDKRVPVVDTMGQCDHGSEERRHPRRGRISAHRCQGVMRNLKFENRNVKKQTWSSSATVAIVWFGQVKRVKQGPLFWYLWFGRSNIRTHYLHQRKLIKYVDDM